MAEEGEEFYDDRNNHIISNKGRGQGELTEEGTPTDRVW